MKKSPLWLGFSLATLMATIQSALFPTLGLCAYTPFLALTCLHASLEKTLWLAALCGLCADLLSCTPFGISALNFTIVSAFSYRLRAWFFKEKPQLLCLYTSLISALIMPMQLALLFLFDRRAPYTGQWAVLDMIAMPLVDAAYAFFWFVGPLMLWDWGWTEWKLWRLKNDRAA